MTDVLGYRGYLAQGGDWGGAISSWLGYEHAPACRAIHINILTMRHPDGPRGAEEEAWAARFEEEQVSENGYRTQQATKPQTLSYAMMDSPVGVAAWIVEKFNGWSDTVGDNVESVHTKDALLTNIMIYLVTRTFNTASWIYYGRREEGGRVLSPEGRRVEVPTGCALFPAELLSWPPRSYVERVYNVTRWTEMPRGRTLRGDGAAGPVPRGCPRLRPDRSLAHCPPRVRAHPCPVKAGYPDVQAALVCVVGFLIGAVTPPLGVAYFTGAAIAKARLESVAVAMLPYIVALFFLLFLLVLVPDITMWLPGLLGFTG